MLPAFTCARAIGNLWSTYLGVNILSLSPCVFHIGNISFLKSLWVKGHMHFCKYGFLSLPSFVFGLVYY